MKQKQKPLIIAVIAGLSVLAAIGVFCITFILIVFFSDEDSAIGADDIAEYNRLAEHYAHYTGSSLEEVPIDELNIPVPGVDYDPEDIKAAFDELYDMSAHSESSGPGYTEVVRNPENIGLLDPTYPNAAESGVPGPDAWAGLGDIIVERIAEEYADNGASLDSALYDELSDSAMWVETGDYIISYAAAGIDESDAPLNPELWGSLIIGYVNDIAEETGVEEDFSFLNDAVTGYIGEQWGGMDAAAFAEYTEEYYGDAWDDYRALPVPENIPAPAADAAQTPNPQTDKYGRIKAEFYPVKYKALGRLFYRETLNEKQQRAYDIAVTAAQAGLFEVFCDFGITGDEMAAAMEAVGKDFPEFFYLAGFSASVNTEGNAIDIDLGIHNDIKAVGMEHALSRVAAKVNPVVAEARKLSSQIDKVKYIVDHMVEATAYPRLNPLGVAPSGKSIGEMQTLWTGIVGGETVCAGYAASFHYYMKLLGIDATVVTGGSHGWNLLELDGDYYYMDVTWIDSGETYKWFNFNEDLLKLYAAGDSMYIQRHTPEGMSASLPAATGTKYGYEKWFGLLEPVPTPEPTVYVPPAVSATVLINGTDVTSRLDVRAVDGVLYAEGQSFTEAFADRGADSDARWFDYKYNAKDSEVYLSNSSDGGKAFTLYLYSEFMGWHSPAGDEYLDISAKVRDYAGAVYVPILAFAENLGEAGYDVEIVLDGNTYSYRPEVAATDPSDPTAEPTSEPGQPGADTVNAADALVLLNAALGERGVDTAALGLTLYYDEPKRVEKEDGSGYAEVWIFLGEDMSLYAVALEGSQVYRYDIVNDMLMGLD